MHARARVRLRGCLALRFGQGGNRLLELVARRVLEVREPTEVEAPEGAGKTVLATGCSAMAVRLGHHFESQLPARESPVDFEDLSSQKLESGASNAVGCFIVDIDCGDCQDRPAAQFLERMGNRP